MRYMELTVFPFRNYAHLWPNADQEAIENLDRELKQT